MPVEAELPPHPAGSRERQWVYTSGRPSGNQPGELPDTASALENRLLKKLLTQSWRKKFFSSVDKRGKSRNARCCNGHTLSLSGRIGHDLRLLLFSKPVLYTRTSTCELTGFAIFAFPRFKPINWHV